MYALVEHKYSLTVSKSNKDVVERRYSYSKVIDVYETEKAAKKHADKLNNDYKSVYSVYDALKIETIEESDLNDE